MALLEKGDKVAVAHRRLFPDDRLRFFIGTVEKFRDGIARVRGYSWVQDPFAGTFIRKDGDVRTKLLPLRSGALLAYVLPEETDVDAVRFEAEKDGALWLTDGAALRMNMTER
jgi:hypothetical protein